jgi:L-asparaginase II/alkylhydroperoxidase/carboxymuconolactone decarboxylase family protein YurZ
MTKGVRREPTAVRLVRGGVAESVHRVHVAVVDVDGAPVGHTGDPGLRVFLRSAAKPFQALPLVEDGVLEALGLGAPELAVACGSHGGEVGHVERVRRILGAAGLGAESLACGPQPPMHAPAARALAEAGAESERIHNNCSGKHAGMLALARVHGWSLAGYHEDGHPVQERMAREVARWLDVAEEELGRGVDGCGVVCFTAPLRALAGGYARLLAAAEEGEPGPRAVVDAMTGYPFQVAGTGRLCTALLAAGGGRVVAKVGAEGVYGAAVRLPSPNGAEGRPRVLGIALKVEDGARRAAEVALVAVLDALGVFESYPVAGAAAAPWRRPAVPNTRGEAVAHLEAALILEGAGSRAADAEGAVRALRPGMRTLARVAAAQAARDQVGLERELDQLERAVRRGAVGAQEVEEALLQSVLFLGYPATLGALALWRRRWPGGTVGVVNEPPSAWPDRGARVFEAVYGAPGVRLREGVEALHPDLARWMVEEGYGRVLGRPGFALRDRELLVASMLAVQDAPRQLHSHLRGALRNGVAPKEVDALLEAIDPWLGGEGVRARVHERWRAVREGRPGGEADARNDYEEGEDVH